MPPCPAPGCILLFITFLFTVSAIVLLAWAIMSDYWEYLTYDKPIVDSVVRTHNSTQIEWFFENLVAKLTMKKIDKEKMVQTVFLVPVYGGIWKLCTDITEKERATLLNHNYTYPECISYLPETSEQNESNDWMTRMQNLAMSCAIVCLILLSCAAFVGAFAIGRRQISAVLVTAVMYILAAVFCSFTLSIIHFKRRSGRECGSIDQILLPAEFQDAHLLTDGWSYKLGWVGVFVCILASILWYLLFKIMRYGPLNVKY